MKPTQTDVCALVCVLMTLDGYNMYSGLPVTSSSIPRPSTINFKIMLSACQGGCTAALYDVGAY